MFDKRSCYFLYDGRNIKLFNAKSPRREGAKWINHINQLKILAASRLRVLALKSVSNFMIIKGLSDFIDNRTLI